MTRQMSREKRCGDGKIGTAEIKRGIAAKEQRDDERLPDPEATQALTSC